MLTFWEYGYEGTSISHLTKVMNISAPSLYAAFGSKLMLFYEVVELYLTGLGSFPARVLEEEITARQAFERLLNEAAEAYTRRGAPPGCLLVTAATNCSPEADGVRERLSEVRRRGTESLRQTLARAVKSGELPNEADIRGLASFYSATLQGMSAQARDGATRMDLRRIAAAALRAWPMG
jgi:AcrR family transcriptional regulator